MTQLSDEQEKRKQEAIARVKSGYYARLLGVSTFLQDKIEEKAHEERRYQRWALGADGEEEPILQKRTVGEHGE